MAINFRYENVPRQDGTLRKAPFIPIYSRTEDGKLIRIVALLDSGADTTVIPKRLALFLGLKESKEEIETGGIGGKVKVKKSKMQLIVKDEHEKHQLNIPILVVQDENEDIPLILGRQGFFEYFNITLRQNEEKVILKKAKMKINY